MAVLLGLLVALSYGAGDFFGGLSSRRLPSLVVVWLSQLVSLSALVLLVAVLGSDRPAGADVLLGAAAGSTGVIGLVLLYRGLSVGAMSIVAPVTAVGAAVLPLGWGLLQGEQPGPSAVAGVALALVAVVLVSSPASNEPQASGRRREVGLALIAGAAFGVVFILFGSTGENSGLWPVLTARVASTGLLSLLLLARRTRVGIPRQAPMPALLVATGVLDATANGLFLVASRHGLLSVVSVLSSLYPATTLVLARIVLHERVGGRQKVGLAGALVGVVLIAV